MLQTMCYAFLQKANDALSPRSQCQLRFFRELDFVKLAKGKYDQRYDFTLLTDSHYRIYG